MLAPQNEELRKLEAQDPTLSSRIRKAFALARKNGYERYSYVELKSGDILRLESLTANGQAEEPTDEKKGKSNTFVRAANYIISFLGM